MTKERPTWASSTSSTILPFRGSCPDAYAAELEVDTICMASHGESALRHLVLGSTALDVLSRSTYPVLLARSGPSSVV